MNQKIQNLMASMVTGPGAFSMEDKRGPIALNPPIIAADDFDNVVVKSIRLRVDRLPDV